jgi:hypothetical protein
MLAFIRTGQQLAIAIKDQSNKYRDASNSEAQLPLVMFRCQCNAMI